MYKPATGIVFIEEIEDAVSKGGIILAPSSKTNDVLKGRVVYASEYNMSANGTKIPAELKVGDVVYFNSFSGFLTELENTEKLWVCEMNEVLCVVDV